jgi:hypothetical protein
MPEISLETKETLSRVEYPDSVEIGTPAKGGCIKVYFNADNKQSAEMRVKNAFEIRRLAQSLGDANVSN